MLRLKRVVDLSDLHIGSTVGLWPPDFISQEGNPIGQNKFQKWLWQCWIDLHETQLPKYLRGEPYALVLNGDIIEGNKHWNKQVMTSMTEDQMRAAAQVLKPIAEKASKIFLVKGTHCHTGDKEPALGHMLHAEIDPSTGQPAFDKLHLDVHGTRCVFRHHMPTAMRQYLEASALGIELGAERIEAARAGHPIPKVLCLAHRHRHGIFKDFDGLVCVTSAWQGISRHTHRVVGSAVPAPSCIVLDWTGQERGSVPKVEDWIYKALPPDGIAI